MQKARKLLGCFAVACACFSTGCCFKPHSSFQPFRTTSTVIVGPHGRSDLLLVEGSTTGNSLTFDWGCCPLDDGCLWVVGTNIECYERVMKGRDASYTALDPENHIYEESLKVWASRPLPRPKQRFPQDPPEPRNAITILSDTGAWKHLNRDGVHHRYVLFCPDPLILGVMMNDDTTIRAINQFVHDWKQEHDLSKTRIAPRVPVFTDDVDTLIFFHAGLAHLQLEAIVQWDETSDRMIRLDVPAPLTLDLAMNEVEYLMSAYADQPDRMPGGAGAK